tara:strand:+ start:67 stop:420 length:354 start_codon:yes stop_codon:yes gene_type:complete
MRNFKNNIRKNKFRNGSDRGFQRNSSTKINGDFVHNDSFRRKNPGKNNHNAPKLIEKYNDLAREALSKGDKILSENYFQHAEHFTRIVNERLKNSYDNIKEIKTDENQNVKGEASKQ